MIVVKSKERKGVPCNKQDVKGTLMYSQAVPCRYGTLEVPRQWGRGKWTKRGSRDVLRIM